MKKYLKRVFTIGSLIMLPFLVFLFTQNKVDHNTLRIQGFYQEKKKTIDVIFFGASEVHTGFSPALAYGEYGYTSYPYAIDSNSIEFIKPQIMTALSYQKPKIIVVEISGCLEVFKDSESSLKLAVMRQFTDVMPLSYDKINTINRFISQDKPKLLYSSNRSSRRFRKFQRHKESIGAKLSGLFCTQRNNFYEQQAKV